MMIRTKAALACAGVAALLHTVPARAAHVELGFFAEARGSSGVAGSSADVWFRSGAFVGTPTAANGGTYTASPLSPGATTVEAGTTAASAPASVWTQASASLERGELKATAAVTSTPLLWATGIASAAMQESIWFTNTSGDWLSVDLTMTVQGTIQGSLSPQDFYSVITLTSGGGATANALGEAITPDRVTNPLGFGAELYGETLRTIPASFQFRTNQGLLDWWDIEQAGNDPASGLFDYELTMTLWVPTGETTLFLGAGMVVGPCSGTGGTGVCDFGNTASLRFGPLADGLSFTSQSGVFLTGLDAPPPPPPPGTAVPEPSAWAILMVGLGALVGASAWRRRADGLTA